MLRLLLLSFFLFGLYSSNFSQTRDTIYFDKSWKVCSKAKSSYFRLVQQEGGIYQIKDYYKGGVLQMQGSAISMDPDEILSGPCTYYYSNGNIKSTGSYEKDKPIGTWTNYHSNGNIKSTGPYENGNRVGRWVYYDVRGKFFQDEIFYTKNEIRVRDSIQRVKNRIPVSHLDKNFSFALRGKALSFFAFEDMYFRTASIGAEFLIKGRHSLGMDYTYFRWRFETDDNEDSPLYETYERREYIYLDYRCRLFSYRNFDYYFNLYDKIGTYHMWKEGVEAGYNYWEYASVNDKTDGTFNQVGAGIGVKIYGGERFYFDVSANGGKLFSNNNIVTYDTLLVADKRYNVKEEKGSFYIRFNFGYKLFVKHKKDVEVVYTN